MESCEYNREIRETREKIIQGLNAMYATLIEFKKQKNSPLIISKNGEPIEVNPYDMPKPIVVMEP